MSSQRQCAPTNPSARGGWRRVGLSSALQSGGLLQKSLWAGTPYACVLSRSYYRAAKWGLSALGTDPRLPAGGKGRTEWSGCRQLASGITSFVAHQPIPQLPPPHQSRGAVGTAGAITGWGCARVGKKGTGGMQGHCHAVSGCGGGSAFVAGRGGGGGVRFAELHAFLKVRCLPAVPLSTCCPSVCLPSCPTAGKQHATPPLCPPQLGVFDISFPSTITLSFNIIALNIISSFSFASFLFSFSFPLSQSI